MTRLPAVSGQTLLRRLQRRGFVIIRRRRSHVFLRHPDGRATVVPIHRGEILGPGLLLKIARDIELDREQLIDLLREG